MGATVPQAAGMIHGELARGCAESWTASCVASAHRDNAIP